MPHEKVRIIELFTDESRWCQGAEATDEQGHPVQFDCSNAVAWDLPGALCQLFGWKRAGVLFGQLEEHFTGHKRRYRYDEDAVIESMIALQNFNDRADQTIQTIMSKLQSVRIWQGRSKVSLAH